MKNMYKGVAFSPETTLSSNISAIETVIQVTDISVFPPAPNLATIGTDGNGETIEYNAIAGNSLSGCIRGTEGVAREWSAGEVIARNYTAMDYNNMVENITEIDNSIPIKAEEKVNNHEIKSVASPSGLHGLKYDGGILQFYDNGEWVSYKERYKTYGVIIDMANSNPESSVTYTDDAIGMIGGSSEWDKKNIFSRIRPCVLKGGKVNYYLDPNDFTLKADKTPSDITSGNDGDVMIEFPRFAWFTHVEGDILTVKITDSPIATEIDPRFHYNAHTRNMQGDRDNFYIGAYSGFLLDNKLRTISNRRPTTNRTIGDCRLYSKANGEGYDQLAFWQLTALQALFIIKYKNLDSQGSLGRGYVDENITTIAVGQANKKGMYYGEQSGKELMKFAGVESLWGNCFNWVDGLISDGELNLLAGFTNFNNTGEGYVNMGKTSLVEGASGAITRVGNVGFVGSMFGGSSTTHFCDFGKVFSNCIGHVGGSWSYGSNAGIFRLLVTYAPEGTVGASVGARLMYL